MPCNRLGREVQETPSINDRLQRASLVGFLFLLFFDGATYIGYAIWIDVHPYEVRIDRGRVLYYDWMLPDFWNGSATHPKPSLALAVLRSDSEPRSHGEREISFSMVTSSYNAPRELITIHWLVAAAATVHLLLMILKKTRRPTPGLCRKCGYDLIALGGAPCPECGRSSEPAPLM